MSVNEQVTRDLMHKCSDDVAAAIMRTVALATGPDSAFVIATGAAASAVGIAAGSLSARCDETPQPDEAADALWETLRPMVIRALGSLAA